MNFLNLLSNKININKNYNFSLIFGLTPSTSARSPSLWNNAYKFIKKKSSMYPADVTKLNLEKVLNILKSNNKFIGGSVTTPYKNKVVKSLDFLEENSKYIGSVNTIKKDKEKYIGYNTDFHGALYSLNKIKITPKKILILGCGGAGKAVIIAVSKKYSKSNIYIYNRSGNKVLSFLKEIKKQNVFYINNIFKLKKIDLIINTTNLGFDSWIKKKKTYINNVFFSPLGDVKNNQGVSSKNLNDFKKKNKYLIIKNILQTYNFFIKNNKCYVFDIIYNPAKTVLLKISELFCFETMNGTYMNLIQAIKAFMIVNNYNSFDKIKKSMMKNG